MRTSSWCFVLSLSACNTGPRAPSAEEVIPPEQVVTPPYNPPPVPDPAQARAPDCPAAFTEEDASTAFGVAAGVRAADCAFEAVRARGRTLHLVWKDPAETEHAARILPAVCSDLPAVGALTLEIDPSLAKACPSVPAELETLLTEGAFPDPSVQYVPDAMGPDGDGRPPEAPPPAP